MASNHAPRETNFREPLVLDNRNVDMEQMEVIRPKRPIKFLREIVWETIFVKEDEELYMSRTPRAIAGEIAASTGENAARRSAKLMRTYRADTAVDDVCQFALSWGVFRDRTLVVLLVIFTTEYVLRVWSCVEDVRFRSPVFGRVKWMRQPMSLIDLFSLIPFYIDILVSEHDTHGSSYVFRTIRLLRIITVFRWKRPLKAMHILIEVASKKQEELMVTFFGSMILILLIGSFMYVLEGDANPEMFPNIPNALWWCISCLSTVGYGDVVPITWMGKMLGSLASVLGVGLFAMPAGILGSGFLEVYAERKSRHSRSKWGPRESQQTAMEADANQNVDKDLGVQNDSSLHAASEITSEMDDYPSMANFTNLEKRMTSMENELKDMRAMISSLLHLLQPIAEKSLRSQPTQ
ncbi:hypothetical protein GUITHDRAFT_103052 [Guillardia theta CCMP2712]|uniref:Ion transport domain-containing protein n=1 Tax=Guillardia theta (strain CCMP2712) TaxID=905079 RepID=L1JRD7_GUITC|nr:hypothetical protein GUITHDRAFT_103052 [Guillardia theta CCMP2712]EKX51131.1 hypothetical protein GUITHDRAFT_103052 [Guillardia theta CCMP2712]|eukprot:XP_005838111.1 hypothetical protein GUITHDRAFT_103052 [Guillardia theta CCMP2712]